MNKAKPRLTTSYPAKVLSKLVVTDETWAATSEVAEFDSQLHG